MPRPDDKTDMVTLITELIARGHALCRLRAMCCSTCPSMPRLWRALPPQAGRDQSGRRPRRRRCATSAIATDFVLWKPSSRGRARLGQPVGRRAVRAGTSSARRWRRPISATIFDIHGGGIDLIFPHHENEIAQSLLRPRYACDGELLDAQRLPAGRGREDVEERSATSSPSANCCNDWPGEVLRLEHAEDALSLADRLDREGVWRRAPRRSMTGIGSRRMQQVATSPTR